jgi:hypothetical protein
MTIVDTQPTAPISGVFTCPTCRRPAIRWTDLANIRCGNCEATR